jgi:hypothetical protein
MTEDTHAAKSSMQKEIGLENQEKASLIVIGKLCN